MSTPATWAAGMLDVALTKGLAVVTMNRPDKLNALPRRFWVDIRDALAWTSARDARAIIITGAGDRAFCCGGDIVDFAALENDADRERFQAEAMAGFAAIEQCPIPIIAAVNGLALGGGCEIAMACDLVMASTTAVFAMPEISLGLVPGFGVLKAASIVGPQLAKAMILAGEQLTAEAAQRHGLVLSLHTPDALMTAATRVARRLADASPAAIRAGKALIDGASLDDAGFAASVAAVTALHGTQESTAAVAAFVAQHRAVGTRKR